MNQLQLVTPAQTPAQVAAAPFAPVQLGLSEDSKLALLDMWRSIAKRKWAILALALAMAVLAAAVAFSMTPVYKSTATVLIESGKPKLLSLEEIYGGMAQSKEHYQTQVEILKSREVALRTAQQLKLWNHPDFDPRRGDESLGAKVKSALGVTAEARTWTELTLAEATAGAVMDQMDVAPVRLSQLVKVSFESADRELAARVANQVALAYIEADRESKFKLTQGLNTWLEERATVLKQNLATAEAALQKYREEQGLVNLSGSAQALAGMQVTEINQRLAEARARRLQLESSYQSIAAIRDGDYSSVPEVVRSASVQAAVVVEAAAANKLAELSENLGPSHVRLQEAQTTLNQARAYLKQQRQAIINSITQEYNAARSSERALEAALANASGGVQDVNRKEFRLAVLEREVASSKQLYDLFINRAKEMDAGSDLKAPIARVVDAAVPANVPVRPKKMQIVLVALVLGLLLGSAASLLLDRLDNTVKGAESAEAKLQQPVLTVLPNLAGDELRDVATKFLTDPNSHHAEAMRTARTGVMLSDVDQRHRIIMVTSSVPAEGKTSTSSNLALALAQTKRTLLIDADMRASQVATRLGLRQGAKGLSNLVTGTATLKECVHQVPNSQLLVIPAGDVPPNPAELLLSQRFKEVLKHLQPQVDFIVIDTPPVELVSDALVIAPQVTSVVYVVRAMQTPWPIARKGISRVQRAGGHMLGVVLNGLDFEKAHRYYGETISGGYGGYYGQPYGQQAKVEEKAAA